MDNETLRAVQLTQLEIAKEIKRICDENSIRYFIDSGTLLGAVRHGGFIPWDDDLDFGMLREDYERFIKIAPVELSQQYFLQNWDNDEDFPMAFAKVRKKGTLFREAATKNVKHHSEIFVDIFPYDTFPVAEADRKRQGKTVMQYRYMLMMKSGMTLWARDKGLRKIMVFCKYQWYKLQSLFYSREQMKRTLSEAITKHNGEKTEYMYVGAGVSKYGRWVVPSGCFDEFEEISFEDTMFNAVKDYDTYLTHVYGDYMQLPPEEKRVNHQIVEVKL